MSSVRALSCWAASLTAGARLVVVGGGGGGREGRRGGGGEGKQAPSLMTRWSLPKMLHLSSLVAILKVSIALSLKTTVP